MKRCSFERRIRAIAFGVALFALGAAVGCGREFRDAAGPALEAGVGQILDGLVDGLFAVFEPDSSGTNGSSPTT